MLAMNTWNEAKRCRKLNDHGINFEDLEAFFSGNLLKREDVRNAYGEPHYQSSGMVNGVGLFVLWTPRGEDGDIPHIISATKAENHETQR